MSPIFLDTNICIYYLKGKFPMIADKIQSMEIGTLKIPSIVQAELLLGALKSTKPTQTLKIIRQLLSVFEIVSFDPSASEIYAEIRSSLEKKGTPIGANDLIIAATVMANKGTLITHNVKEFKRIANLQLEDWCRP